MQVVHLRVDDADTGQATPVRLRLTTPEGTYLPPLGRLAEFPLADGVAAGGNVRIAGRAFAYVDGACEVRLPAGPVQVEVHKGPEYRPLQTTILRPPGKISLRLSLSRLVRLEESGWYAGDTHAQFLSPAAAALEGAAEGLHLVQVLASREEHEGQEVYPGLLDFSGRKVAASLERCQVAVNTLNRADSGAALALLHAHRIVFPLRLGQEGFEHYTLADWCRQCHRKGGLVVQVRFPQGFDEGNLDLYRGSVDALEWTGDDPFEEGLRLWYRLLNHGLRLPLVGGSGKRGNGSVLGDPRTYAQLAAGQPFGYSPWIEAVRAGRTFATRGPLLRFEVGGRGPGAVLFRSAAPQAEKLLLRASLWVTDPGQTLEIVRDGEVVARGPGDGTLEAELPASAPCWLAARCRDRDQGRLTAHTSPVYVT